MDETITVVDTIDITPSWGQWAGFYTRLAESKEVAALRPLRADMSKMANAADALSALIKSRTLTDEQAAIISPILARG